MDKEAIAILHLNPQNYITGPGIDLVLYFDPIDFFECDIRFNDQMSEGVAWAISLKPDIVLIGVPDETDKTAKNVKAVYEWLAGHNIATVFVLSSEVTLKKCSEYGNKHGVKVVINQSITDQELVDFLSGSLSTPEGYGVLDDVEIS